VYARYRTHLRALGSSSRQRNSPDSGKEIFND
jgi:hypothetical protein